MKWDLNYLLTNKISEPRCKKFMVNSFKHVHGRMFVKITNIVRFTILIVVILE